MGVPRILAIALATLLAAGSTAASAATRHVTYRGGYSGVIAQNQMAGEIVLDVDYFDNGSLLGRWRATNDLNAQAFRGTHDHGACKLQEIDGENQPGARYASAFRCTDTEFVGTGAGQSPGGPPFSLKFEARAVQGVQRLPHTFVPDPRDPSGRMARSRQAEAARCSDLEAATSTDPKGAEISAIVTCYEGLRNASMHWYWSEKYRDLGRAIEAAQSGDPRRAWASTAAEGEPVQEAFRGSLTYRGSYSGKMKIWGDTTVDARGEIQIDLFIEPNGTFRGGYTSTGVLPRGQFEGVIKDRICTFNIQGNIYSGRCDKSGFNGRVTPSPSARVQPSVAFATTTVSLVDYDARDRAQAIAAKAAEEARQARIAVERAEIAAARPAAARTAQILAAAVADDASRWVMNVLDRGSVKNVRELGGAHAGMVRAEYTYNDGRTGWVRAKLANGAVSCLEFWDYEGICATPRHPPTAAELEARREAERNFDEAASRRAFNRAYEAERNRQMTEDFYNAQAHRNLGK